MIILMFHDVLGLSCPISGFQTIGAKQYQLDEATFEKFVAFANRSKKDVIYTFDDGGVSFLNIAAPILEKYGERGIFCITTSRIGTPGFLSEDQIRTLDAKGHIIASHSHTHPGIISKLSDAELFEEWRKSKEILENILGKRVVAASVPGGAVSKKVLQALFKTGYSEIYTSEPSSVKRVYKNGFVVGRFTVKRTTSDIELKKLFDSSFYRYKLLIKYRVLRVAKALMGSSYNVVKQRILKVSDK